MTDHVGKVVDGRYRLDSLLGEGTTGAVYAATQLSIDRTVALKLLHQGDDADFRERFANEARAIGQLNQTNIVTLHDFGYDDELDIPYMVMEYAEGVPLSERMEEPMSTDLVLRIALEIASALHHAHASGILHRDLKPENVILTRADGRVDVAKVLDFGLAHLFDPTAEEEPDEQGEHVIEPRGDDDESSPGEEPTGADEPDGPPPSLEDLETGSAEVGESEVSEADDEEGDAANEVAYGSEDEEPPTAIMNVAKLKQGAAADRADQEE